MFVRNVGYDTDESQFKEFMENFGEVKYAVLCKVKEMKLNAEENGGFEG